MAETKRNRNAQTLKTPGGFQISRNPLVQISADDERRDVSDGVRLPGEYGARRLFAIARDPRTIFASWNIDWLALFEQVVPRDQQVHLRVHRADGLEQKTVAVEPLAAMHYLTTSGTHASYRVEIGYYDPADVWHSVAMSQEIVTPPDDIAETTDVDLATLPFHVGFQQLLDFFGPSNGTALATVVSQFQKRVLSSEAPKFVSAKDKKILRELGISASAIEAMRRAFDQPETETLLRRTGAPVGWGASSPSRGFADTSWS
jgi:hypothetical protein